MKIYLIDQAASFQGHLSFLKSRHVMKYDRSRLVEKISCVELNTKKKLDQLSLDFLFNYDLFPNNIMTSMSEWNEENREMRVGDTIIQQAYLPPVKTFSQKVIFGVRVNEIINEENKIGFSYETLEGHVEKGISTFTVEANEGKLIFKIHTFSTPGNILTKLLGPIFSVPYQTFCTKAVLKRVKKLIENQ